MESTYYVESNEQFQGYRIKPEDTNLTLEEAGYRALGYYDAGDDACICEADGTIIEAWEH